MRAVRNNYRTGRDTRSAPYTQKTCGYGKFLSLRSPRVIMNIIFSLGRTTSLPLNKLTTPSFLPKTVFRCFFFCDRFDVFEQKNVHANLCVYLLLQYGYNAVIIGKSTWRVMFKNVTTKI